MRGMMNALEGNPSRAGRRQLQAVHGSHREELNPSLGGQWIRGPPERRSTLGIPRRGMGGAGRPSLSPVSPVELGRAITGVTNSSEN